MPNKERRRSIRIHHSHIISYTHYDKNDEVIKEGGVGTTSDISMGGLSIRVADKFSKGNMVDLNISLGDQMVKASGIVVNIKKIDDDLYDVGIEFKKINKKDLKTIKDFFVDRNVPL